MNKLPPKRKDIDKNSTKSHVWKANPDMEKEFIDMCNESASLHGYQGASLKSWTSVIKQLNAKYNMAFDQKTLKNKWTSLRGNYVVWRKLTHKTGHGRNEDGSFDWPEEIWKEAIKSDYKVARFRFEPLMHFKELEQLFEGTFAVGDDNVNVGDDVEGLESEATNADIQVDILENEVDIENDPYFSATKDASPRFMPSRDMPPDDSPGLIPTASSNKASGSSQGLGKRKRSGGELSDITNLLRLKFDRDEEEAKHAKSASMGECNKILNAMKLLPEVHLDKMVYATAKIKLCSNHEYRIAFLDEETIEDKQIFLEALAKS